MYLPSRRIKVRDAESLGKVFDPYFNRSFRHFCSHQHAPYRTEPSGFDAGAMSGNVLYFAHPVFTIYRAFGMVYLQEFVLNAIRRFIGAERRRISLPLYFSGKVRERQRFDCEVYKKVISFFAVRATIYSILKYTKEVFCSWQRNSSRRSPSVCWT